MDTQLEIKNARIKSTHLGFEHGSIFTCTLFLDYGGLSQGFGGYIFDRVIKKDDKFVRREGAAFGAEFIRRVLEVAGASSWETLPGKSIRVKAEFTKIHAIGHYLKDDWLNPEELAKKMRDE